VNQCFSLNDAVLLHFVTQSLKIQVFWLLMLN